MVHSAIRKTLGATLLRSEASQKLTLKLSTFPRFYEWTKTHQCKTISGAGREKKEEIYNSVWEEFNLKEQPINYWEFGVYRGASIQWWIVNNQNPQSQFVGFDSFEGLPEDWNKNSLAGRFYADRKPPEINDSRVHFVVGWFHQTLPNFLVNYGSAHRKVVHLDADLFRSSIFVLLHIGPHLRSGDILIFDEFSDSVHEFRAFEDYVNIFKPSYEAICATMGYDQVAILLRDS